MAQNAQINLGRVTGKSAYEEWLLQPGNAGKSFALFLESIKGPQGDPGEQGPSPSQEQIADAFILAIDESPNNEPSSDVRTVSSKGIYEALTEGFGAQDEVSTGSMRFVTSGAVARAIGDFHPKPEKIPHTTISSSYSVEVPTTGGTYYFLASQETAKLTLVLPANSSDGTRVTCYFMLNVPHMSSGAKLELSVAEGGSILENGDTESEGAYAFMIEGVFYFGAWAVDVHRYIPVAGVISRSFATIVYSGANRNATENISLLNTVEVSIANTLSSDAFQNLYGIAPLAGWTTDINGTTAEYELGEIIPAGTIEEESILTLYPVYTATEVSASQYFLNGVNVTVPNSTTGTATATPPVSGGYTESLVSVKVNWSLNNANADISSADYKIGNGSYVRLASKNGKGGWSGSKWIDNVPTGSVITVKLNATGSRVSGSVWISAYKIG